VNTVEQFSERFGRLGNQLFQLGLLFAVEARNGHRFHLPRDGQSLWRCFDLDVPDEGPPCTNRFEEAHGSCIFDPRAFDQPDGTVFHGYFQSYRYLEGCEDALRRLLRFRVEHRALAEALGFKLRRKYGRPLASIHIRRGDYVRPESEAWWGNLVKDGYYDRAVDLIGHDVTYVVFSDDMPWCRESFGLDGAEFADLDPWTSLCLMSICDVNVVANSSYSWWAAFMNPGGEAYAPRRWFAPGIPPPNHRQDDVVPPSWRTIPTFE
jgi:hypothetical protein